MLYRLPEILLLNVTASAFYKYHTFYVFYF